MNNLAPAEPQECLRCHKVLTLGDICSICKTLPLYRLDHCKCELVPVPFTHFRLTDPEFHHTEYAANEALLIHIAGMQEELGVKFLAALGRKAELEK